MSWLDEAKAIVKSKEASSSDELSLATEADKEAFKKEVMSLYENATERELDHAIERIFERFDPPFSKKEIMLYIKQFVEDA